MSERNFNIQFKECAISVIVPVKNILCNTRGLVKTVAKTFASLRDCSKQDEEKVEYDCMRAMLEYADIHGATWCELTPASVSAIVTLYFTDTTDLIKFKEGVAKAVESVAMK